jgi:ribosomal protein S18 acetylase RimI-like enzyme
LIEVATPCHDLIIRPFEDADVAWAEAFLEGMGGRMQARRGELIDVLGYPGFVADCDGARVGVVTYRQAADESEICVLIVDPQGMGLGTALVEAVRSTCSRPIRVVTTNDNQRAVGFYQRLGFRLREVRIGAVDDARRRLKPSIPALGAGGIPIRDELELELP